MFGYMNNRGIVMHADIKAVEKGYIIKGQEYVRVTEVMSVIRKKELEVWRGNIGNEEADRILLEAQDTGTRVHLACEEILKGITTGFDIRIRDLDLQGIEIKMVENFQGWVNRNVKGVILLEEVVFSEKFRYAGRLDALVFLRDGKEVLIDIKTTGAIYDEVALQLAAYKEALKEMEIVGDDCRRMCVRLDKKTGSLEIREFTGTQDFQAFLCCLGIYNWLKGGKNV